MDESAAQFADIMIQLYGNTFAMGRIADLAALWFASPHLHLAMRVEAGWCGDELSPHRDEFSDEAYRFGELARAMADERMSSLCDKVRP